MKKINLILTASLFATASAKAETVDFEAEPTANVTEIAGWSPIGHSGIHFFDTLGSLNQIKVVGTGSPTGYFAEGTRALGVEAGDSSAIMMVFDSATDIASVSLDFLRDNAAVSSVNNWGRLRIYDNLSFSTSGVWATDLATITSILATTPMTTIYKQGDGNGATPETISYTPGGVLNFDIAVFDIGTYNGTTFTAGNLRENIDNVNFTTFVPPPVEPEQAPVPEVQTYATLFGAALIGAQAIRRRRA